LEIPLWYVVHTKHREEERADSNLRSWEVLTFYPRIRTRRVNQFSGKITELAKPLFPGYLFARFDASKLLSKVHYTRGVQSVISFGDSPTPIDESVIELIQSRVQPDGFVQIAEEFQRGDKVTVKGGLLKGLHGVFNRRIKGTDRVHILLKTVSYQAGVTIERDQLGRI
jgi:transcriptional antiterminator RfaH